MRYLIVDGHSMIFAWRDLAAIHRTNMEAARDELINRMARYQDSGDERVVLVFDGRGGKTDSSMHPAGIQVVYSKAGQSADSVIERLAANYAGRHDIRVATSDRMEQMTVSTFGASFVDAGRLAEELQQAEAELARRIRRHNARH